MTIDRKILCYQKPYVMYGIIATLELVYRSLQRDDQMPNFIFRSIIKFDFGLTKKIFNLRLTEGIIDRKFPTFYEPICPYKTYIFYCYVTFVRNLMEKVPHRVQGSMISPISGHQGTQCVMWSC